MEGQFNALEHRQRKRFWAMFTLCGLVLAAPLVMGLVAWLNRPAPQFKVVDQMTVELIGDRCGTEYRTCFRLTAADETYCDVSLQDYEELRRGDKYEGVWLPMYSDNLPRYEAAPTAPPTL